jgi:hypothetical protein
VRRRETTPTQAKAATLSTLKRDLEKEKIGYLDHHKLIEYGRKRADHGSEPVTPGIDIGVIKMILAGCPKQQPSGCPRRGGGSESRRPPIEMKPS